MSRYPTAGAEVSECGLYRYRLWRLWSDAPAAIFVMLNPSTADAEIDDPTIRRVSGFAKRWKCGGVGVVNLYARRTSSPAELFGYSGDIVGPKNDGAIGHMVDVPPRGPVVCAWGARGSKGDRARHVYDLLRGDGVVTKCLGLTQGGQPKHPLYLRADSELVGFAL